MILGIGTDIIEVERIALAIKRRGQPFLNKLFTEKEQAYCLKHKTAERNFAGRFAAKEAIAKALGNGIGSALNWLDIEIARDKAGKPYLKSDILPDGCTLHLSISHCKSYALATAILEKSN